MTICKTKPDRLGDTSVRIRRDTHRRLLRLCRAEGRSVIKQIEVIVAAYERLYGKGGK